jgi:hypothetical protein
MYGNIFAVAMTVAICASLAALKVHGKSRNRRATLAGVLHMAAAFLAFFFVAFGHGCHRGGPLGAVVLGSVFIGVIRATVERKFVLRIAWVGWFAVTFGGMELCHEDGYVGGLGYIRLLERSQANSLAFARELLLAASEKRQGLCLPEGWIENSWKAATEEEYPGDYEVELPVWGYYWHTWFTGVFLFHTRETSIWCAGGPLESCAQSLEIRDRDWKVAGTLRVPSAEVKKDSPSL